MNTNRRVTFGYLFYLLLAVTVAVVAIYAAGDPEGFLVGAALLFPAWAIFTIFLVIVLLAVTYLTVVSLQGDVFLLVWPLVTAAYLWFAAVNIFSCVEALYVTDTVGAAVALFYSAITALACAAHFPQPANEAGAPDAIEASALGVWRLIGTFVFVFQLVILYLTVACVFSRTPLLVLPTTRITPVATELARLKDNHATLQEVVASLGPPTSATEDTTTYAACKNYGGIPWLRVGMRTECVNFVLHFASDRTLARYEIEDRPASGTIPPSATYVFWSEQAIKRADWQAAYRLLESALVSPDPREWTKARGLLEEYPQLVAGALESFSLERLRDTKSKLGGEAAEIERDRLAVFRLVADREDYETALRNLDSVFGESPVD